MCITSKHLRDAEEEDEEQDLDQEDEEEDEDEEEQQQEINGGDSEASDSERSHRRTGRIQVSFRQSKSGFLEVINI